MESKKENNVQIVRHAIENTMGSAKGNYAFFREQNKELTPEDTEKMNNLRDAAIQRLERALEKEENQNEAMSKFMDALKASDWSTEESLLAFKKNVFDPFVAPEVDGLGELRDNLFRNRLQ